MRLVGYSRQCCRRVAKFNPFTFILSPFLSLRMNQRGRNISVDEILLTNEAQRGSIKVVQHLRETSRLTEVSPAEMAVLSSFAHHTMFIHILTTTSVAELE
jgi:hypothetical protein